MKTSPSRVLTINAGSSSVKFAVYRLGGPLSLELHGKIDRIGLEGTHLIFQDTATDQQESLPVAVVDHSAAAMFLIDWLEGWKFFDAIRAVGHRVVHGMAHAEPTFVTTTLVGELHRITPYAPDHLPQELGLIQALHHRHPGLPQLACFDTSFHCTMPRVARLLPIPRRYEAMGPAWRRCVMARASTRA